MTSSTSHSRRRFAGLIAQTARHWRRLIDRQLQPYGLTEATWVPLLHISRAAAPMRQKELAESIALDASSVVRLLDSLQAQGFIERREGSDRRAKEIHLTARGLERVDQVEGISRQVRDSVLVTLPEEDIERVNHVLEQVLAALDTLSKDTL
ncbi:MAG: MarR family winged helix-turn-helix transcriptional regulator [Sodalis sp. (in: enterobacteria)]|uniref:MarR family winged helix-turn-helix transcriptional regulator n=1 Tax=Sodalis sp. (in: enterobacteria) TaxID=1898979 RepID=UPI003FD76934